ncbi:MAG: hypothetical protein ACTHMU_01800 [Thermomicrobiales bacterium]
MHSRDEQHTHKRNRRHSGDPEQAWLSATEADTPGGLLHAGDPDDAEDQDRQDTALDAGSLAGDTRGPSKAGRPTGETLGDLAQTAREPGSRHHKSETTDAPTAGDTGDPGAR